MNKFLPITSRYINTLIISSLLQCTLITSSHASCNIKAVKDQVFTPQQSHYQWGMGGNLETLQEHIKHTWNYCLQTNHGLSVQYCPTDFFLLIADVSLVKQQATPKDLPNRIDTSGGHTTILERPAMSYEVKVDRLIRYSPITPPPLPPETPWPPLKKLGGDENDHSKMILAMKLKTSDSAKSSSIIQNNLSNYNITKIEDKSIKQALLLVPFKGDFSFLHECGNRSYHFYTDLNTKKTKGRLFVYNDKSHQGIAWRMVYLEDETPEMRKKWLKLSDRLKNTK